MWLGLDTSVGALLLLYRLIARGNLVNVTSLLCFMPGVTAVLDGVFLGNPMPLPAILGLSLITAGIALIYRKRTV
ncbi:MAG: EamA family transporter [Novosphingobium sp.]